MDEKIDKRTKEYRDSQGDVFTVTKDYSLRENNPGWTVCCVCGGDLPPNEDGSKRYYRQPTPCDGCVLKNYGKAMIDGKEVDIDSTDPPKRIFDTDPRGKEFSELRDSTGKVYGKRVYV